MRVGGLPIYAWTCWRCAGLGHLFDSASLSLRFAARLSQRRVDVLIPAVVAMRCLTDGGRPYPGCPMLVSGADSR